MPWKLLAAVLLMSLVGVGSASARPGAPRAIVLEGQEGPGAGGATLWGFRASTGVNGSSAVLFDGSLSGGTATAGVYLAGNGGLVPVALQGDTAPPPGGTFTAFNDTTLQLNDRGDAAFTASIDGLGSGLVRYRDGVLERVAYAGDPAPSGGTFTLIRWISLNTAGDVAFTGDVSGGQDGVFLFSGGLLTPVVLEGDVLPGIGTVATLVFSRLSDDGDVALAAGLTNGVFGVFLESGGTFSEIARSGDPAPGTAFGLLESLQRPVFNRAGEVGFRSTIEFDPSGSGIFLRTGGQLVPVVLARTAAPGGGELLQIFDGFFDDQDRVVFPATLFGAPGAQGIFRSDGTSTESVLLEGDVVLGTGGRTVSDVWISVLAMGVGGKGQVAADVTLDDGSEALVVAGDPPTVPALAWLGRVGVAMALLGIAAAAAHRRRP